MKERGSEFVMFKEIYKNNCYVDTQSVTTDIYRRNYGIAIPKYGELAAPKTTVGYNIDIP
jgi:hypothetical protein